MDKLAQKNASINKFLFGKPPVDELYGDEVHFFMHCHLKGYDRTGEGLGLISMGLNVSESIA